MNSKKLKLNLKFNETKNQKITIKGFFKGDKVPGANDYLGTDLGSLTTVPAKKTVYYCLGEKSNLTIKNLKMSFWSLLNERFLNANYDLNTFTSSKITIETVCKTFLEILFQTRFPLKNHKTKPTILKQLNINVLAKLPVKTFENNVNEQQIIGEYLVFCRNLQNEAPNIMTPQEFANQINSQTKSLSNLEIEIWDSKQLASKNFNLFLAVAAGSANLPRLVKLTYRGNPNQKTTTALIGKGITFDTGGYSLKPSQYQKYMKYDMSGAAIACSTLLTIARLKLPVNVTAIACLSENLIGKNATLVESVIKSKSGLTVEITNTDAEGRLVVADAITYAINDLKVNQIIELSTLTGAITVVLGDHITGAFSNNERLYKQFEKASLISQEPIWKLPVAEYNRELMRASSIADLINASSDYRGGASNAAAFLFAFAKSKPFLHLDIAGTATTPSANKQATAVMLKTLLVFFKSLK